MFQVSLLPPRDPEHKGRIPQMSTDREYYLPQNHLVVGGLCRRVCPSLLLFIQGSKPITTYRKYLRRYN